MVPPFYDILYTHNNGALFQQSYSTSAKPLISFDS